MLGRLKGIQLSH